jgi:serine/threonine protein phosphatase PrpC
LWDAVLNQEAVKIVSTAPNKEKTGERLVKYAMRDWKRKRSGISLDDMSATKVVH